MKLPAEQYITRAKIKLYEKQPFFSYIVNHLVFTEKPKEFFGDNPTIAVDNNGNCFYYKEFIEKLNDYELEFVLSHEAMHCALMHLDRFSSNIVEKSKSDVEVALKLNVWNIATDLVINNLLINNGFIALDNCIKPKNDTFEVNGKIISDISKKSADAIYNELIENAEKVPRQQFDMHIFSRKSQQTQNEDNSNQSTKRNDINKQDWKQILIDAGYFAKSRGKLTNSLERIVDKVLNSKMNWKQLLYTFITNEIKNDFTYKYPSRKFISTGIYFPTINKENLNVMVAIDTSGSINNKELELFLGELYKITSSFNNIQLEVLFHDTEIKSKYKFDYSNIHMIKSLKAIGYGGTSHMEVFEYANKVKPNCLIIFSDGYSDINECKKFEKTLFVLTNKEIKLNFGKTIYIDLNDI